MSDALLPADAAGKSFSTTLFDVLFTFTVWRKPFLLFSLKDAGAAVGQGVKSLRQWILIKNEKKTINDMLVSLSNNVDRKSHRKAFWIFWVRIVAIQFDLDEPWNYLWYCYEKAPLPSLPIFKGRWAIPYSPASLFPPRSPPQSPPRSVKCWVVLDADCRHVTFTPLWV